MLSTFPVLEIKKLVLIRKIIFLHNIAYMVNLIVISLDISVMINIFYKKTKIPHEKILNAIYFY